MVSQVIEIELIVQTNTGDKPELTMENLDVTEQINNPTGQSFWISI